MNKVIALESRLRGCSNVLTLGVKTNFGAYSAQEADLIRAADKIYYPTTFYADLFDAVGKKTFPSYHTYKCVQDKIKQTALFNLAGISHPRTRVFYGDRQKGLILQYFSYPFIAKIPRGSALGQGVFLVQNGKDLDAYCGMTHVAYIQEYLPMDRDMRVVIIGNRAVHAYWKIAAPGEFRTNVGAGAAISFEPLPEKAIALAVKASALCRWDDVGIDICEHDGQFYILEANMKYGKEGFRQAGIDYLKLMEKMIQNGEI
ncbi:MAG: RimK family alpha-L-glutamate ligase [Desulfobacterales bacterium]|nr:RimK family alpha-L-glutamate ligase [Desulfobacterales bacterium]